MRETKKRNASIRHFQFLWVGLCLSLWLLCYLVPAQAVPRPLATAASEGDSAGVAAGLAWGLDPDTRYAAGTTALIEAARYGYSGIVLLLLDARASVNLHDDAGNSALSDAVAWKHRDTAILLLKHGADPNVSNEFGSSPLHHAALFGDYVLADSLCSFGADPNVFSRQGATPLFIATSRCDRSTCVSLLLHGADPNTPVDGVCPLRRAVENQCLPCADVIRIYGGDIDCFASLPRRR